MKPGVRMWAAIAAVTYLTVLLAVSADVRGRATDRDNRMADYRTFISMIVQAPPAEPARNADPLLVRLQRSVEQMGLSDRAAKLSAGAASPGRPALVTISVEGAPFERIADMLERISAEAPVEVPVFRLERSGASDDRFDFSATFMEYRGAGG